MIVKQSMRISIAGMILGVALSFAFSRFLSSLLFRIEATDPWIYTGTTFVALFVALIASALPANRASRRDPLLSLREE
jgi:putative ABC transport system permease protein